MFKQIILNIKRYNLVSLDMIMLITLFLFIFGCLLLSKNTFDKFATEVKDKLQISVFLKNSEKTTDENLANLKEQILKDNFAKANVKSIEFIDRKNALETFIKDNPELKEQFDMLEENPLKNHFLIKLNKNNYKNIKEFVGNISSLSFIDDIVFSEDLIKNIDSFFKYMIKIGAILFMFFLVIIIWILNYTVKIDLHYKKLEFLLWRYLGAKSEVEYFLVFGEAFIIGIMSGIFAILLLFLFYWFVSMFLFNIQFLDIFSMLAIIVVGILLSGYINFIVFKKSKNEIF